MLNNVFSRDLGEGDDLLELSNRFLVKHTLSGAVKVDLAKTAFIIITRSYADDIKTHTSLSDERWKRTL